MPSQIRAPKTRDGQLGIDILTIPSDSARNPPQVTWVPDPGSLPKTDKKRKMPTVVEDLEHGIPRRLRHFVEILGSRNAFRADQNGLGL